MAKSQAERGRFSSRKKMEVVLRGEDLDLVSLERGSTPRRCSEWRDHFVTRGHDGTITTARPNQLWGTDATSTVTREDGPVTVFVGFDQCTLEGIGIHVARHATRFEALEPIHKGVRQQFGTFSPGRAGCVVLGVGT